VEFAPWGVVSAYVPPPRGRAELEFLVSRRRPATLRLRFDRPGARVVWVRAAGIARNEG
jgi:hypothetical protein